MGYYVLKIALTALVVVAVAEIAKRSTVWGALLASLPLTSLLAMIWLYLDTQDSARVAALSLNIFWLVLPSMIFFVALWLLLRAGWNFWGSLALSAAATAMGYGLMLLVLKRFGISL